MKLIYCLLALCPLAWGASVAERGLPIVDLAALELDQYSSAAAEDLMTRIEMGGLEARAPTCPRGAPYYCRRTKGCCPGIYCCVRQCCNNDADFCSRGYCYKYTD